jgi:hypothetical protein
VAEREGFEPPVQLRLSFRGKSSWILKRFGLLSPNVRPKRLQRRTSARLLEKKREEMPSHDRAQVFSGPDFEKTIATSGQDHLSRRSPGDVSLRRGLVGRACSLALTLLRENSLLTGKNTGKLFILDQDSETIRPIELGVVVEMALNGTGNFPEISGNSIPCYGREAGWIQDRRFVAASAGVGKPSTGFFRSSTSSPWNDESSPGLSRKFGFISFSDWVRSAWEPGPFCLRG